MIFLPNTVLVLVYVITSALALVQPISTSTITTTITSFVSGGTTTSIVPAASPTDALAEGILKNIDIQVNELAYVQLLLAQVTATTPFNTTAYLANKTCLLAVQSSGVVVRASNQAIAPSGNAAVTGLSSVAVAQASEIALASALTGNIVSGVSFVQFDLETDSVARGYTIT